MARASETAPGLRLAGSGKSPRVGYYCGIYAGFIWTARDRPRTRKADSAPNPTYPGTPGRVSPLSTDRYCVQPPHAKANSLRARL